jgi:hypothetical protein
MRSGLRTIIEVLYGTYMLKLLQNLMGKIIGIILKNDDFLEPNSAMVRDPFPKVGPLIFGCRNKSGKM